MNIIPTVHGVDISMEDDNDYVCESLSQKDIELLISKLQKQLVRLSSKDFIVNQKLLSDLESKLSESEKEIKKIKDDIKKTRTKITDM